MTDQPYFTMLNTEIDQVDVLKKLNDAFEILAAKEPAKADPSDDLHEQHIKHFGQQVWDAYDDKLSASEIAAKAFSKAL